MARQRWRLQRLKASAEVHLSATRSCLGMADWTKILHTFVWKHDASFLLPVHYTFQGSLFRPTVTLYSKQYLLTLHILYYSWSVLATLGSVAVWVRSRQPIKSKGPFWPFSWLRPDLLPLRIFLIPLKVFANTFQSPPCTSIYSPQFGSNRLGAFNARSQQVECGEIPQQLSDWINLWYLLV